MSPRGIHNDVLTERELMMRLMTRLIEEYGYSRDEIAVEALLPGKGRRRADLVVYRSADKIEPFIILEVKRKISYPSMVEDILWNFRDTSAEYIVLSDGVDWTCFRFVDGETIELPDIPKKGEELSRITRGLLKPAKNLAYKLWKIMDMMRSEGLTPEGYVREVNKLMLCKIMDEKEGRRSLQFTVTPLEAKSLASDGVQARISNRISSLFENVKKEYPDLFSGNEKIELSPVVLGRAISTLQSYSLTKTDPDIVGAFYEEFIGRSIKGTVGQYFTPRGIVGFVVQLIDPQEEETVLDPACKSGGFILESMAHVWNRAKAEDARQEYAHNNLFAMDNEEKMVLTTKMNLLLHRDGHSNVFQADIFRDSDIPIEVQKVLAKGGFDVIVGRAPMGLVSINGKRKRVESVFIERCLQFLNPRGRMALIVPENVLFSNSLSYFRKSLIENNFVRAVISLPVDAFLQYGTSIKTSILLIEKSGTADTSAEYDIFMAHLRSVDARAEISLNDYLTQVLARYQDFKEGKHPEVCLEPTTFLVKSSEAGMNWAVGRYAPPRMETIVSADLMCERFGFAEREIADRFEPRFHLRNLESVADVAKGVSVHSKDYLERPGVDAIPYIRIGDMQRGTVIRSNLKYVQKRRIDHLSKGVVRYGDILFSTQGTIGKVAEVPRDLSGAIAASQIAILRARREIIDPDFLRIVLSSSFVREQLEPLTTGSIIRYLSSRDLRRLRIIVPPKNEQQRIVERVKQLELRGTQLEAESQSIQKQIEEIIGGDFF